MPKASKSSRDSATREPKAKRSKTKASDHDEVDMPNGMSKEYKIVGKVGDFEIRARDTTEWEHCGSHDTTHEVPYRDIALAKQMPWFIEHAAMVEKMGQEFPHTSHGYSRVLTNVHRAHPSLAFSWNDAEHEDDPPDCNFYDVIEWESAGVWRDSEGTACLVIRAAYENETERQVHMLYEETRKPKLPKGGKAGDDCLWVVLDEGRGDHLKKVGGQAGVKCDLPCKPPA